MQLYVMVCVCVRQLRRIGSGQKKEEDRENPQQLSPKWRQIRVKSKEHQLTGPTSAVCVKSPANAWTYSNVHCGVHNDAGTSAVSSFNEQWRKKCSLAKKPLVGGLGFNILVTWGGWLTGWVSVRFKIRVGEQSEGKTLTSTEAG